MAGTNKAREPILGGPIVVLVEPQLGENIGMVARAMLNCGLTELRLVKPRDGWPSETAQQAASGADRVLADAKLFDSTAEAIADLPRVYAATTRNRDMVRLVETPRQAAAEMRAAAARGEPVAVLFGPERTGLHNDDVALAERVVEIPMNPAFASINLAGAVLIVGYEWFQAASPRPSRRLESGHVPPADKAELIGFLERLEGLLDDTGFLFPPEKRPNMVRNLRAIFQRAELTGNEVRTLHGVVSALVKPRDRGGEGR